MFDVPGSWENQNSEQELFQVLWNGRLSVCNGKGRV